MARKNFVLAGNKESGEVSVREFGGDDYKGALDAACDDVGWDNVMWGIYKEADALTALRYDFARTLIDSTELPKVRILNPKDPIWELPNNMEAVYID